jgi:plastocyanin domain-containing protein
MKSTIISIIIGVLLIGAAVVLTSSSGNGSGNNGSSTSGLNGNNVSIVDGKQIITITAKGGYQPRKSVAKAGLPTTIRFDTNGTFDCSSFVRIPSLNISKSLPQSGLTDIDIGTPSVVTLQGMCGMGMYRFEVEFKG